MSRPWLWCLFFVSGLVSQLMAAEPKSDHYVVLISVDGLAHFYFDDPKSELPTIRGLAKKGAHAKGGMQASFPSVTWPNHTTLVTGVPPAKHGVLGNDYLDRETAEPVALIGDASFDKSEIVKVPTIYDLASQAGLKTASILWPASRNAKTLNWTVPDMSSPDSWPQYGTPDWLAELRQAGLPVDKHSSWGKEPLGGVLRDTLYTRMFRHVWQNHRPNLTLIHLVEVDHVEHKYGPQSPEAYWATSFADDRVRDIVETVNQSDRADRTTIIVASDHGFFPISHEIRPNVLFKDLKQADGKPAIKTTSQGGGCMLYVLDEPRKDELIALAKERLQAVAGIEKIIAPEQYATIGQFTPAVDRRAPDLWLAATRDYSFSNSVQGENAVVPRAPGGTHGYLTEHPELFATLILSGAGIRPGTDLGHVSNMDVAPTIAELLGLTMSNVDGKVLKAALKK